ncbi:MAG: hypothetical protein JWO31_3807 [Phycisphaerales bacterium]|nr:hypothetical protein [Phycisphaerales bacterium]
MGLARAIKRSYRFFIPPSLQAPRKLVRRTYEPAIFYLIGLTTGLSHYARPDEAERVWTISIIAFSLLLALKWWSGAGVADGTAEK